MTAPDLMTTAQAAERLDVTPRTILRMVDDGRIKAFQKLPGTGGYLFQPAEVERVADAAAKVIAETLARIRPGLTDQARAEAAS